MQPDMQQHLDHGRESAQSASFLPWLWAVLAAVTAIAWFPVIQPITPVAEDRLIFDFYADGYFQGLARALEWQGVWRIFGFSLVGWAERFHPLGLPLLAVMTHFANVCVFAAVSFRLLGDYRVGTGLALLLAALPVGYQVLAWAVCFPFALASLFFWVQLYVTIRYCDQRALQKPLFPIVAGLTLIGALSNECLLGASLATGSWLWLRNKPFALSNLLGNMRTYYAGWAPFLGAAVYVAGYYAFRADYVMKTPGAFNPRSLLSAYYHTLSAAAVFGAWTSPLLRDLGFEAWDRAMAIRLAALVLVLAALIAYGAKRIRFPETEPRDLARAASTTVCLLLGASFIYAVGGGFSPESRKLYPISYLIALAAGLLWVASPRRCSLRIPVALALMCFVPTCWLMAGIWRFEATRAAALAGVLVENGLYESIAIQSDTDPYEAWPYLAKSFGFRFDEGWVLDHPLNRARPDYPGGLKILPDADALLTYRRGQGWTYERREIP